MPDPLPYVTAALLCERILQEKDESLTLIRIADRLQYQLLGVPEGFKPLISIQGLVSLKSGPIVGDHTVTIVAEKPNGQRKEVVSYPVKFFGKDQGQNLILNIGLGIEQDGLHWFDVLFDGELLTRVPLMVTPMQEQAQPSP